jgi:hypothetical protein
VGAPHNLPEAETIGSRIKTKICPDKDTVAKVFVTDWAEKAFADNDVGIEAVSAEDMAAFGHSGSDRWVKADRADKVIRLVRDDGKQKFERGAGARMMAMRIQGIVERALEVRTVRKLRELSAILVDQLHVTGDIRRRRRRARSPEDPTLLGPERHPARSKLVRATWGRTPAVSGASPLR